MLNKGNHLYKLTKHHHLMTFFNSFFGMAYISMMPAITVDVLNLGADSQGTLMSIGGIGAFSMTMVLGSTTNFRHKGLLIIGGGAMFGLSVAGFAITAHYFSSFPIAAGFMIVMGMSSSIYMISIMSSLQLLVPDHMRGRVMGFYGMTWSIMPLGGMQASALTSVFTAPIAIAAVTGTVFSRLWFGDVAAFVIPGHQITSYWEFPAFALLGLVSALVAILFQFALIGTDWVARNISMPVWLRPVVGGFAVGLIALVFPDVLGVGYETTDAALKDQLPLAMLFALLFAKTAATAITLASFATFDTLGHVLAAPAAVFALNVLEGNFVTPAIHGQRFEMSPLMVFFALFFWGWLWGVAGMLMAVPLLVVCKVTCDHIEELRPVGRLLGR